MSGGCERLLFTLALMPIMGIIFNAGRLWTALLAFLAGATMTNAHDVVIPPDRTPEKQNFGYGSTNKTFLFLEPSWSSSLSMEAWAASERAILLYIRAGNKDFKQLSKLISDANKAYNNASDSVRTGILRERTYTLAGKILGEWHRELAINYTSVDCYDAAAVEPVVQDMESRLYQLEQLYQQNKLSPITLNEAKLDLQNRLIEYETTDISKELVMLLTQLLGYDSRQSTQPTCYK